MEVSDLLVNLVIALAVAVVGAAVAARPGQSVVLGYILAGVVIGPHTPGFVGDRATVDALANIGVILLLFAIGVQLSFRELLGVGKIAIGGGTVQVLLIIGVGYLVGSALGWPPVEALFFGAVISNSSSTVLTKVLEERGEGDSRHGRIALAWSSVQDFGTIVLVVVLTALAGGGDGLFTDLLWALGKAALFLVLLVPLGLLVFPRLFERVAALRQREVFILTVAAVALGTAYVSSLFGLSLALGAFAAGVVVGESDLSHHILGEVMPLRDIFAGLFFIAVGMLVDPVFVVQNLPLVVLALLLIVVVKGAVSAGLTFLAGFPVVTAVLTGVGLAQSAEFSFLMARVGTEVDAVSSDVFSLMLASAAVSILVAPALHRAARPVGRGVERRIPRLLVTDVEEQEDGEEELRGHAVICGYGRVGRLIGTALQRRGFSFVAIDHDQRTVRDLRKRDVPVFFGNAENPVLLQRVHVERARMLIIALPDPVATRQIVDYARGVNPRLDIVVRASSEAEREFLELRGVSEAVVGERELALEMTRHVLHRSGVSGLEIQRILQGLRGGGGSA